MQSCTEVKHILSNNTYWTTFIARSKEDNYDFSFYSKYTTIFFFPDKYIYTINNSYIWAFLNNWQTSRPLIKIINTYNTFSFMKMEKFR